MSFFSRHILPWLIDTGCGTGPVMKQRAKVVPRAEGRVLEVGVGSGLNLGYYDPARVTRVTGLDISPELLARAEARAQATALPFEPLLLDAQTIPLQDASVDTVLVTYTLCSIPDPMRALAEMRRVLIPGGRLLFCEHGLAPDAGVQRLQRAIGPVWKRIAGNCHLDRQPHLDIARAGFRLDWHEEMYLPNTPRFGAYTHWGEARPA